MEDTRACPFCGQEIKATAKKCRFCGKWLEGDIPTISPTRPYAPVHKTKNSNLPYILVGAIVFVAIIIAIVIFSKSSDTDVRVTHTDASVSEVIPSYDQPSTADEVIDNTSENNVNDVAEVKEEEPWRIHLNKLQGTYLIDPSTMADAHDYAKYVISGTTLTMYYWNRDNNTWEQQFSSEFQLFNFHEDSYMNGYNLIYTDQYGNESRMCSGDLNDDGKMDLWQSDSMYWTKQ